MLDTRKGSLLETIKAYQPWQIIADESGHTQYIPPESPLDLTDAGLEAVDFRAIDLPWVNFSRAKLMKSNLNRMILHETNFSGADLSYATLFKTELIGAMLNEANCHHITAVRSNFTNATAHLCNFTEADLYSASFMDATLEKAVFKHANLFETSFDSANLRGADLSFANAGNIDLEQADLTGANLTGIRINLQKLSVAVGVRSIHAEWVIAITDRGEYRLNHAQIQEKLDEFKVSKE